MMNQPQGKINLPGEDALVSRHFLAEGIVNNLPAGQHLFLVVEIDGQMWPKGEARVTNSSWACEVHEGGNPPGGRFSLSLFVVGDRGYVDINAWLEHGKMTGSYPGLINLEDSRRLSSLRLRLAP
jgi:hypothetical protein